MDMTCASGCAGISACSRASRSVRSIPHWPASRPPARSTRSPPGMRPRIRRRAHSPLRVPSQARGLLYGPPGFPAGSRDPSGTGTRGRHVYELTARGDELFHHLLETEETKPEGGRGFALRWAFARYLSPDARLLLLQRRRAQLVDAREGSRRAVESPWRPLDRYQRSLLDHANEAAEHDLNWIERLIEAEKASLIPSSAPISQARPINTVEVPSEVVNAVGSHARATLRRAATERSEP